MHKKTEKHERPRTKSGEENAKKESIDARKKRETLSKIKYMVNEIKEKDNTSDQTTKEYLKRK